MVKLQEVFKKEFMSKKVNRPEAVGTPKNVNPVPRKGRPQERAVTSVAIAPDLLNKIVKPDASHGVVGDLNKAFGTLVRLASQTGFELSIKPGADTSSISFSAPNKTFGELPGRFATAFLAVTSGKHPDDELFIELAKKVRKDNGKTLAEAVLKLLLRLNTERPVIFKRLTEDYGLDVLTARIEAAYKALNGNSVTESVGTILEEHTVKAIPVSEKPLEGKTDLERSIIRRLAELSCELRHYKGRKEKILKVAELYDLAFREFWKNPEVQPDNIKILTKKAKELGFTLDEFPKEGDQKEKLMWWGRLLSELNHVFEAEKPKPHKNKKPK